jgi:hypothetical protein
MKITEQCMNIVATYNSQKLKMYCIKVQMKISYQTLWKFVCLSSSTKLDLFKLVVFDISPIHTRLYFLY